MALRICKLCGLEANNHIDLEKFVMSRLSKHGRQKLCKKCANKRALDVLKNNDRLYLRHRFNDMRRRCYNIKADNYPRYGGRGISICQEWLDSPDLFIDWSISHQWNRELQIDRINNYDGYNPDNCRWVTIKEQANNRRKK